MTSAVSLEDRNLGVIEQVLEDVIAGASLRRQMEDGVACGWLNGLVD